MEGYVYLGAFFLIVIIFAIQSYRSKKEEEQKLKSKIEKNFGKNCDTELTADEILNIKKYYEYTISKRNGEYIDDITYNDLNMDSVFMDMNNTYSSVGETYLYSTLRMPLDKEKLEKQNKLITYFEENKDNSKSLQMKYSALGKNRKINIIEAIHEIGKAEKKSNLPHYLCIIAFIVSVIILLTKPLIGIFAFIAVIAINVISYYRMKNGIDESFLSFRYLVNILKFSELVPGYLNEEFSEYIDEIQRINNDFSVLKKRMFLISDSVNGSITGMFMDYARMLFHVDIIKFNNMIASTNDHMEDIDNLYEIVGKIETAIAIASYRLYLKDNFGNYSKPEFDYSNKALNFENIYHPLINDPVKNSLSEDRCVLLTGSNASGKSTFLKTVALNVIFARTIYTCMCDKIRLSEFAVFSSMSLRDDLKNNESYYIVEIKSLKRIIDNIDSDRFVLCFVDEVLRGTNTVERIAASSEILLSLSKPNVMCFAATHDIELTYILENVYSNYHFEEHIENDDVKFDYILNDGRATTRNAISLLKVIGYKDSIIENAKKRADKFISDGCWV